MYARAHIIKLGILFGNYVREPGESSPVFRSVVLFNLLLAKFNIYSTNLFS